MDNNKYGYWNMETDTMTIEVNRASTNEKVAFNGNDLNEMFAQLISFLQNSEVKICCDPRFVLFAGNKHIEECGEPPMITTDHNSFTSYFENEHGEQWLFQYIYGDTHIYLWGGDVGWSDRININLSRPGDFVTIMSVREMNWYKNCFEQAREIHQLIKSKK